ncbi:inositol phosphorylceramide synthase [Actinomadura rudentiformis]|uniref:Inositol phosphorylceramide synthase n=1 Tax=Actinomadura rudentiformis TaxID=359158 RepID=A0A6H9Z923_9ACTN|nr:inositol phosphorylceramide synthase [Actinomadura rudentiformis]
MHPWPRRSPWFRPSGGRPRPIRELLLVAVLFGAYKLGRVLADGRVAEAFDNAHGIWDLERSLRLPSELDVQQALLHNDVLVHAANSYYAYAHFPATAAFLLWIYLRRPAYYRWIRWVLVTLTAAGLVLHLFLPLAPPRMLTGTGLIDTGAIFGPAVYGAPQTDTLANQYAAMPSLHIGWAIILATGLIVSTRDRWRWWWIAHPVITVAVVVATANHYWLDGIVVGALLAVVLLVIRPPVTVRLPVTVPTAPAGPRPVSVSTGRGSRAAPVASPEPDRPLAAPRPPAPLG